MTKIVKSLNTYELKDCGRIIVYNSLFGNARVVDEMTKQLLNFFEKPHSFDEFVQEINVTEDEYPIVKDIVNDFLEAKILVWSYVNK